MDFANFLRGLKVSYLSYLASNDRDILQASHKIQRISKYDPRKAAKKKALKSA